MKKKYILFVLVLLLLFSATGCSGNVNDEKTKQGTTEKNVEIMVSAAASLQDALTSIKTNYEKEHPNVKINFNFGGSGALEQQISQGAPVDLFFSAAEDQYNKLVKTGQIDKEKGTNILGNELVLVVPRDSNKGIRTFEDLKKAGKIAIGTPATVPAGQYAQETLETLNLWKEAEGKVVYTKDVRQVLTYVESGNVDAGIVYKTDALISHKVKIVAAAKDTSHAPIIYPIGVIKSSSHLKEARDFYQYLHSEPAMKIFEKYGFNGLNQ